MTIDHARAGDLLDAFVAAWTTFDGDEWSDLFTDEVEYHPGPFSAPLLGRAAVRAYLLQASQDGDQVEITIERHWVVPPTILAAFHASHVRRADRARVRVAGFLTAEVADDGRIARYREWTERRAMPSAE